MKLIKFFILVILITVFPLNLFSTCKILKILYYERPPYYYTDSYGNPKGVINNIVKKILDNADIKYKFESVPAKRILYLLKNNVYSCSPGWFKTKERLKLYKYTLPIYQSEKEVAVFNRNIKINNNISIKKLFKLKNIKLGLISGFKYAPILEKYIKKFNIKFQYYNVSTIQIFKMIVFNRISYTFLAKDNVEYFFKINPNYKKYLKIVSIKELKKGEKRYIICSKDVGDKIIKKIDMAIIKINKLKR